MCAGRQPTVGGWRGSWETDDGGELVVGAAMGDSPLWLGRERASMRGSGGDWGPCCLGPGCCCRILLFSASNCSLSTLTRALQHTVRAIERTVYMQVETRDIINVLYQFGKSICGGPVWYCSMLTSLHLMWRNHVCLGGNHRILFCLFTATCCQKCQ